MLKHIERANYQTAVWNQSLSPKIDISSPVGNGWILDGEYKILWMTFPATPDSLLEIVKCSYARENAKPKDAHALKLN